MFHLTRKIDYGLILMLELYRRQQEGNEQPASLKQIAKQYFISFFFLQKIAKELREKGLITAARGKEGGYVITQKIEKTKLYDIFTALEGSVNIMSCFTPKITPKIPSGKIEKKCTMPAHKGLSILNEEVQKILNKISLSDFFKV